MAVEDTFNGAKNGYTMLHAYTNTVAQAIGMEQALALATKMNETMGAAEGKMYKELAGIEEFDIKAAYQRLNDSIEDVGILSEVIEESPQRVIFKVGRCPIYEAAQALGMDTKAIEANCCASSIRFMEAMAKQLNPNLSYQLTKFRSAADDYCEEAIVLA
jgi:predicted ArsR family transcriptional regulator